MKKSKSIKDLSELEFALVYDQLHKDIVKDPLVNFFENEQFLNFTPYPAQRVLLKTIFGQPLDRYVTHPIRVEVPTTRDEFKLRTEEWDEYKIYRSMTAQGYRKDEVSPKNKITLICGRRSGKSIIAGGLGLYCVNRVNYNPYLKKNRFASILILSHSKEFSEEIVANVKKFIEESEVLTRLVNEDAKNTQTIINFKIPFIEKGKLEYSYVQMRINAASPKTVRGGACAAVLLDEIAFMNLDPHSPISDADVVRAVTPNLQQFGKLGMMIKLSSPSICQGVLYEDYEKRHEYPNNHLVVKAPSWFWTDDIVSNEGLEEEYHKDPAGFDWEYRGNFVDAISGFIIPEKVEECIERHVYHRPKKDDDYAYIAAIDSAYKREKFTFTIIGIKDDASITQFVAKAWEGSRRVPVSPKEAAKEISRYCEKFDIGEVYADQYGFQPLKEIFNQYGLKLVEKTFSNEFKKKIYANLKTYIHQNKIELLDQPLQEKELKQLVAERLPSGNIRIGHPPKGTDDMITSLAVASFMAVEFTNQMQVNMQSSLTNKMIQTDQEGRAFTAPSPDMVSRDYFGTEFLDNTGEFIKDKKTGRLRRRTEDDDDEEDGGPKALF